MVDPLVGLAAGLLWFGEAVALGTDAVLCGIVLLAGVVLTQLGARAVVPVRPEEPAARRPAHVE